MRKATAKQVAEAAAKEAVSQNGHITLTNAEAQQIGGSLQILVQMTLPIKTSFRIAQLAQALNPHLSTVSDLSNALVKKYGKKVPGSQDRFKVTDSNMPAFEKERAELLAETLEIPKIVIVLPASGYDVPANAFVALAPFLEIAGE